MLYQLSYLGPRIRGRRKGRASGSLTGAFVAVQPGIGRRTGKSIAFAKPLQQVAILAAAAAEGRMVL